MHHSIHPEIAKELHKEILATASVGVDIDAINNDTSRFESFGIKHHKYQSIH